MRASDANLLRASILRLDRDGPAPAEIAQRLGCDRTTVYRVLKRPAPDRRVRPADGPVESAIVQMAAQPRLPVEIPGDQDPYSDVADDEYRLARADRRIGPEAALARMLLRHTLRELTGPVATDTPEARARRALRKEIVGLLTAFKRLAGADPESVKGLGIVETLLSVLDASPNQVTHAPE